MIIPEYVAFTLDRLEDNGYSAYLVGGCVRDFIMGITPHDFDITTNALPEQIEECFNDIKTLDIGKKHGTISLVFDKEIVEVTTYRIDGEYKDSRHPESVTFTDKIEDDLSRRDFTMNAIAYSPKRGFVDPFDGRGDIEKTRIVCVGNPEKRFDEDALRIMRALRFSSRLGFEIEKSTKDAMTQKAPLLCNISAERIREEFIGIIDGRNFTNLLSDYGYFLEVLSAVIPELHNVDYGNLFDAFCDSDEFDLIVKLCVFFDNFTEPQTDEILHRLKFDNKTIKTVMAVTSSMQDSIILTDSQSLKKCLSKLSDNAYFLHMTLACKFSFVNAEVSQKHLEAAKQIELFVVNGECVSVKQLRIKGNEIIDKYGIKPSETGEILSALLNDVIEEKVSNENTALLEQAKQYI